MRAVLKTNTSQIVHVLSLVHFLDGQIAHIWSRIHILLVISRIRVVTFCLDMSFSFFVSALVFFSHAFVTSAMCLCCCCSRCLLPILPSCHLPHLCVVCSSALSLFPDISGLFHVYLYPWLCTLCLLGVLFSQALFWLFLVC